MGENCFVLRRICCIEGVSAQNLTLCHIVDRTVGSDIFQVNKQRAIFPSGFTNIFATGLPVTVQLSLSSSVSKQMLSLSSCFRLGYGSNKTFSNRAVHRELYPCHFPCPHDKWWSVRLQKVFRSLKCLQPGITLCSVFRGRFRCHANVLHPACNSEQVRHSRGIFVQHKVIEKFQHLAIDSKAVTIHPA